MPPASLECPSNPSEHILTVSATEENRGQGETKREREKERKRETPFLRALAVRSSGSSAGERGVSGECWWLLALMSEAQSVIVNATQCVCITMSS